MTQSAAGGDGRGRVLRVVLRVQAALYVITGVWPLIDMHSFERVTGPKTDDWLVQMVGLLAAAIGLTLWTGARMKRPAGAVVILGAASAISFAAIDLAYGLAGRIAPVYLLDAAAEGVLLLALWVGWRRASGGEAPTSSLHADQEISFDAPHPILRVADFDASVRYYTDALGFGLRWQHGRFCCVSRGEAAIFLSEGSQGCGGTWMYIGVSDADALHEELLGRGARIRHPPANFPWGSRELHVFDADGHVLRFGAPAPEGAPFGEWLDEEGVRWRPLEDGRWERVE